MAAPDDGLLDRQALLPEPLNGVELDDRLVVRHADHHHDPDQGDRVQALPGHPEEENPAGARQRNGEHHQQRCRERGELAREHQEHQRDRQHPDQGQLPGGSGLFLLGAAHGDLDAQREVEARDLGLHVRRCLAEPALLGHRFDHADRPLIDPDHFNGRPDFVDAHQLA